MFHKAISQRNIYGSPMFIEPSIMIKVLWALCTQLWIKKHNSCSIKPQLDVAFLSLYTSQLQNPLQENLFADKEYFSARDGGCEALWLHKHNAIQREPSLELIFLEDTAIDSYCALPPQLEGGMLLRTSYPKLQKGKKLFCSGAAWGFPTGVWLDTVRIGYCLTVYWSDPGGLFLSYDFSASGTEVNAAFINMEPSGCFGLELSSAPAKWLATAQLLLL